MHQEIYNLSSLLEAVYQEFSDYLQIVHCTLFLHGLCEIHKQPASVPEGTTNSSFQFVDNTIVIPAPKATNVRIYLGFDETPNAKSSAKPCT